LDLGSIRTNIAAWCLTTPDFYYVAQEYLSYLHGAWYTRQDLDLRLKEAYKMRLLWANAMKVEYLLEYLLYPGHFDCQTTNARQRTDTTEAMMLSDLSVVFMTFQYLLSTASVLCLIEVIHHRIYLYDCESQAKKMKAFN
ncbi:hypothetical protein BIW11_13513, partial [Tropilaelaps mercedesae]